METVLATNKRARALFKIEESFESGIELRGTEVKSIRSGGANLKDSYVQLRRGEAYLVNCHISPYRHAGQANHEPERPRKLLLHRYQLNRLTGRVAQRGYTIVPLAFYLNEKNRVKVEIGLARGKKQYDRREQLRQKSRKREEERERKKIERGKRLRSR
jgi:SsrA-binding protein